GLCQRDGLTSLGKLVGGSDRAFESIFTSVAQMADIGGRVEVIVNITPYIQKAEWLERLKRYAEEIADLSYRRRALDAIARREGASLTEHVTINRSDTPGDPSKPDTETYSQRVSIEMGNLKHNRHRLLSSSDRLEFIGDKAYARETLNKLFANLAGRRLDNSATLYGEPVRHDDKAMLQNQIEAFQKSSDASGVKDAFEAEKTKLSNDNEYLLRRLLSIESLPRNTRRKELEGFLGFLARDLDLIDKAIRSIEKLTDREFRLDASEALEVERQAALIVAQTKSVVMSTLKGALSRKAPAHFAPITLDDVKSPDRWEEYKHKVWYQERLIFLLCSIAKTLESGHRTRVMTEALREAHVLRSLRGTILRYLSSLALIVPNLDGQQRKKRIDEMVGLATELIEWSGREKTYFETPYCEALVKVASRLDPTEQKGLFLKKALELTDEFPNNQFKAQMLKQIAEQAAFDQALLEECLEQTQKIPEAALRSIPLSTIVLSLEGKTAYETWALLSDRMTGTRRPELLFIIYHIASAIKQIGGDPALWQTANGINAARGWIC
ncbi:MAG: hypothetical protein ACREXR_07890, partial [Gammaproteobacteria bacterium]